MTLGEIIRDYRARQGMSGREFAHLAGITNGYVSMLESGVNPRTGAPIAPSLKIYRHVAAVMGVPVGDLLDATDDGKPAAPVYDPAVSMLDSSDIRSLARKIAKGKMPEEVAGMRRKIIAFMRLVWGDNG